MNERDRPMSRIGPMSRLGTHGRVILRAVIFGLGAYGFIHLLILAIDWLKGLTS